MTGQRFCSNCGAQVDLEDTAELPPQRRFARNDAPQVRTDHVPSADEIFAPEPPARGRRGLIVGLAVAAIAVAVGAAAAVVVLSNNSHSRSDYPQKVGAAFIPVTHANHALSGVLVSLHGSDSSAARRAVANAQNATNSARGALGALTVPGGSHQLATAAQQALDRETSYLTGLNSVLAHPSVTAASQLHGLAGNLTSALDAVGAPIAGTSQNVTGYDAVVSWARRVKHHASTTTVPVIVPTSGPTPNTPAPAGDGFTACDQNIEAQAATTTCGFAENTFYEYWANNGGPVLEVFSPQAGTSFEVTCSGGEEVLCTTPEGAAVQFPQSAVDNYTSDQAAAYAGSHNLGP